MTTAAAPPTRRASYAARAERRRLVTGLLFISPWIVGSLVFTLGPVLVSLYLSFCDYRVLTPPHWLGGENYRQLLADEYFWRSLGNTAFMFIELPLGIVIGIALAMLLNASVRGQPGFRTLFYLPSVVPVVASAMLWLWIFNPDPKIGLLNGLLGMLSTAMEGLDALLHSLLPVLPASLHLHLPPEIPWLVSATTAKPSIMLMDLWGVGGGMIIYLAALQGVPQHLYEAADIDGASSWQKTWHITLPSISPVIFFMVVTGMLGVFQYFTSAYIMTSGGPEHSTLFYALYLFQNAFQYFKMGYACAMAWILFLISLVLTLVVFRSSARWVYYEEER